MSQQGGKTESNESNENKENKESKKANLIQGLINLVVNSDYDDLLKTDPDFDDLETSTPSGYSTFDLTAFIQFKNGLENGTFSQEDCVAFYEGLEKAKQNKGFQQQAHADEIQRMLKHHYPKAFEEAKKEEQKIDVTGPHKAYRP